MPDLAPLLELRESAELMGELLKQAGERSGQVPPELWREIAEAAVKVAAAAEMLAGDIEDEPKV